MSFRRKKEITFSPQLSWSGGECSTFHHTYSTEEEPEDSLAQLHHYCLFWYRCLHKCQSRTAFRPCGEEKLGRTKRSEGDEGAKYFPKPSWIASTLDARDGSNSRRGYSYMCISASTQMQSLQFPTKLYVSQIRSRT